MTQLILDESKPNPLLGKPVISRGNRGGANNIIFPRPRYFSLGTVNKGRLAKIEEDKANSSKASHGMEPCNLFVGLSQLLE